MIIIELFWTVFGIGYVIYKGFKEERKTTLSFFKYFGLLVLILSPIWILGYIANNDSTSETGRIVASLLAIVLLLALICFCFYMIYVAVRNKCSGGQYVLNMLLEDNEKKRKSFEQIRPRIEAEIVDKFAHYGYHIDNDVLDELISNPLSPINGCHSKEVTLYECYKWLCKKYTWDIDKLKEEALSQALGVQLEIIPLDETLPIGEAHLQRTLLARNYLLMQKGLEYHAYADSLQGRYSSYLNKRSGYYALFNDFVVKYIAEHQQTKDTP